MVTIIIPNYNGYSFLPDCLDALQSLLTPNVHVLVVDNGSTDESVAYLEQCRNVETLLLPQNTGFCGAVNAGIKASRTKYVILLNNDTRVLPGYVDELVRVMEQDEQVFSASARMLQMHAPDRIDDAGDEYCALGWAFSRGKDKPASLYDKPAEVFAACGGASIYRREVFWRIGFFDERHFAYLEDIDIGYRARLYGYRNVYAPKAEVLHVGSGSSGSRHNAFKVHLSSRNSVYLPWKNMPLFQLVLNAPFLTMGYLTKYLFFRKKGFGKEYKKGFLEGLRLCSEPSCKEQKARMLQNSAKCYWHIQLLLWKNLFRLKS